MDRRYRRRSIREMLAEPRLIAGAAPSSVSHPLGPPTISGNNLTVDLALKTPTRVTRTIMDLTLQKFIADRLFASAGGVSGGAVVYDEATENELYTDRDVRRIAPGGEYPNVTSERGAPKVAEVEKWGGKLFITDEARDRNDQVLFANEVRKLANTIVRKINARAVEVLDAAVTAHARTIVGNNWATTLLEGNAPTAPQDRPTADFAAATLDTETKELGIDYNIWIVNPQEYTNLIIAYGDKLEAVLRSAGIDEMFRSNRVTAGTAYAAAERQVGEMRVEQPLASATWREENTDRTWMKSGVRPVMFVNNPFAVLKFTGLAG